MQVNQDIKAIVLRGKAIYEERIRDEVEPLPGNIGKYISIDVDTGDWVIADNLQATTDQLHAKHPGAMLYSTRVGYPALVKMGSWRHSGWTA